MKSLALSVIIFHASASKIEDTSEKRTKVSEERIQSIELNANELNFPLFLEENIKPYAEAGDNIINTSEDTNITHIDFPHDDNEYQTGNFITISHKIIENNVTKEGLTTISSSAVMPLLKTALDFLSIEDTLVLALGGLLPFILLSLPFVVIIAVVPLLVILVLSLCSIFTSVLFFTPMALFGFGLYATADSVFVSPSDKLSSFDFSPLQNLPSFEDIETISEKINQDEDNITGVEENSEFQIKTNNVPRSFF